MIQTGAAREPRREPPTVSLVVLQTDAEQARLADEPAFDALLGQGWQGLIVDASESLKQGLKTGLARARGQFVIYVTPDQVPTSALAQQVLDELCAHPDCDVMYFDEAPDAERPGFVKPAHSPERLRSQNYWGSFVAYKGDLLQLVVDQSLDFDGAEFYALALRASRRGSTIRKSLVQVPRALCVTDHARRHDNAAYRQGVRRALDEHFAETGGGFIDSVDDNGIHQTRRHVVGNPLVSVIVPTRGSSRSDRAGSRAMVLDAVEGIVKKTTYDRLEFVIVADDTTPDDVIADLRMTLGDRLSLVPWSREFSFSEKMNLGVVASRGEYLLFLNDDVDLISPDWVQAMLSLAQLPRAGTVGAMLYFDDDTVQHAGHAYSWSDVTHVGLHSDRGAEGPNGAFLVEREVDGNTAACMMIKRDRFFEAGGFSPILPGNFNDVDLCMKMNALGYVSYWTPRAELYHFESATRDPRVSAYEVDRTWGRWGNEFGRCGFWPTDPHVRYRKGN